jgi:hypothetical protein
VSIPLIYFLAQYQPFLLAVLHSVRLSDPLLFGIIYTSFFSAAKPIAGIVFGIAFWTLSKKVADITLRNNLIIAAYGMMLMFTSSNTVALTIVPLPPFGIITAAFFGLSAFLFLIGVYFSALSAANDYAIRKNIKLYSKQLALLDRIGASEMTSEREKMVKNAMKVVVKNADQLALETGVPSAMSDEDYKEYINMVLKELKKKT